jgi:hypothetical protein
MLPVVVSSSLSLRRGDGLRGVAFEPGLDDVMVKLLAPQQPPIRLADDIALIGREVRTDVALVERIGLGDARIETAVERFAERFPDGFGFGFGFGIGFGFGAGSAA